MKKWKLAIIMLVVALLLAACGSKEETATEGTNETAGTARKTEKAARRIRSSLSNDCISNDCVN